MRTIDQPGFNKADTNPYLRILDDSISISPNANEFCLTSTRPCYTLTTIVFKPGLGKESFEKLI